MPPLLVASFASSLHHRQQNT
uniref:Uncharacterized protein n=1 Tax=Nelumbo nucifera TaxID=4432 RepID=A0A822ZLY6_NELNU|nr:TPA_asm: hypothetical protein HUJ06_004442 [Nelumbo nucifera]